MSIRQTTGIEASYTTIATVAMYLIVAVVIVLLNLYVGLGLSFRVPCFVCSINIPDVATSICAEAVSGVPRGLPFYDRAFGQ